MSTELTNYRKSIINRSFWLAAGIAILFSLLHHKDYSLGILIGVGISALNFLALSLQVLGIAGKAKQNRFGLVGAFLMRYGLLAVCVYFIVKVPQINVFGFLIGYCILQLNLFLQAFLSKKSGDSRHADTAPTSVVPDQEK